MDLEQFLIFKPMKSRTNLIVIALILTICTGFGQSTRETLEKSVDSLFAHYTDDTPGVAVAVVKEGNIIFEKGYGMATLEYNVPITPKTIFHVASISKQFTAYAIHLLEREGKISFEDDIRKYLPEVPDFGKPIAIKHLFYHTSGLRDQWALLTLAGWRMDDVITTEHILKLVGRQKELNFPTGTQFTYNNTGFTLLAEIVERISGQSFADFTKENIFDPLGMNATQFYDDYQKTVKNRAYSYALDNGIWKKRKLNYSTVGATSLFTTVEDLAKWTQNFKNPVIGDADLLKKFNLPTELNDGKPLLLGVDQGDSIYHAKGQFFRTYRGLKLYEHSGGDAGFRSYLGRYPDQNVAIIALSNDENFETSKLGFEIAGLVLGSQMTEIFLKPDKDNANEIVKSFESSLLDFEGEYYSDELTTSYTLKEKEGRLVLSHRKLSDALLSRDEEDTFSGNTVVPFTIKFLRNESDTVSAFLMSSGGANNVRFERRE